MRRVVYDARRTMPSRVVSPDFALTGVSEAGRTDGSPSAMPLVSSIGSFDTARGIAQPPVQPASAQVLFKFHLPVGLLPGGSAASPMPTAKIDALATAALAMPADGVRQSTYHTVFRLIAVTGMRHSRRWAWSVMTSTSTRGTQTRCAACARHARTLPNGLKCAPRSYPSSADRGKRSATRIDRKRREWISSTSIQPS